MITNLQADRLSDNKAAKRLLKILDYDSRVPADDLETCLKLGDTLDEESKARASAMVQNDKLRI
jgi:hypothetical protein